MFNRIAQIGNYKIPSEIMPHHIHKRGAIAMAVQEQYYKMFPNKINHQVHTIFILFKKVQFQINTWIN